VMAGISFAIEAIYRKATGRQIMRSFTDDETAETV